MYGICHINVAGCCIISISEMYMILGKFSSSSRQMHKKNVMKICVFIDLNIRKG